MMFSILPLNIGDAFCFICLPNLTDIAANDDRTIEATRESVFVFCCSVVVPPAKGLELLRFVVEVFLKFFLEACQLRLLQWFLGAISCAEQFCRVHTIYISVRGGKCTAHDHRKPAIHIMY